MTPSHPLLRAGGAALALALALTAAAAAQPAPGEPPPAAPAEKPPLQVGDTAPDINLSALRGKRVALSDLRGQVVLLDFWATWCPYCRDSVRELKKLREDLAGRPFALVSITGERDRVMLRDFVTAHQMDWPQAWDEWGKAGRDYRIKSLPTYLVLDPKGRIVHIKKGWGRGAARELRTAIDKALAEAKTAAPAAQAPVQRR